MSVNPKPPTDEDPLETFESVPAVSFHAPNGGHAVKEKVKLDVIDWPKLLDQRDDDGKVETWDNGDPKKVLVVKVHDGVDEDGKPAEKSLWAKKTSRKAEKSLYQVLAKAQKAVREATGDQEYRLGPGDTLWVVYTGDDRSVPPKKGNYPKMFAAKIIPGERPVEKSEDPFGGEDTGSNTESGSDPWADSPAPAAGNATPPVGGDPFGDATGGEDEPPF